MTKRWRISVFVLLAVCLLFLGGGPLFRFGYESPAYDVVSRDGKFEIRIYEPLTAASTQMPGVEDSGSNRSFRELFNYISGENEDATKIAMTVPVFMDRSPEESRMSFVLPRETVRQGPPEASSTGIRIDTREIGRVAVMRFSGLRSGQREASAVEKLQAWIEKNQLKPISGPFFAYYDPPYTPGFMRRNEVMIQINSDE